MKEFLEYVIKQLVDKPDQVRVDEIYGEHTVIYELRVGDEDMGKVIGRNGQTANSPRTILAATSAKHGKRSVLEIVETNGTGRKSQYRKPERIIAERKPIFQSSNEESRWQDDGRNNL